MTEKSVQTFSVESFDAGQIVKIKFNEWNTGKWAESEFPHPLITIDYDADDNLLAIVAARSKVHLVMSLFGAWIANDEAFPADLLDSIRRSCESVS
jgi:hypothetical protein